MSVASLVITTFALGIAEPDESVTVPEIRPTMSCAAARLPATARSNNVRIIANCRDPTNRTALFQSNERLFAQLDIMYRSLGLLIPPGSDLRASRLDRIGTGAQFILITGSNLKNR